MSGIFGFRPILPDTSMPVPISEPKQLGSTHFDMLGKDNLASAGEEGFDVFPANYPISERGQLSLAEFAKVINDNLAIFAQTQEAAAELHKLMNRKLGTSLAATASALRKYRSKLLAYIVSCKRVAEQGNFLVRNLNRAIAVYNEGLAQECSHVEELNEAIVRYNHLKSRNYSDIQSLRLQIRKFTDYVEDSQRNSAISALNKELILYREAALEHNAEVKELNPERAFFHWRPFSIFEEIADIPLLPVSLELENSAEVPLIRHRSKPLPLLQAIDPVDLHKAMKETYDPVFNAAIGYMSDISNVFNVSKLCKRFGRTMFESAFVVMIDPALSQLAGRIVQRFGTLSRKDSAMRIGISWNTLDRILAGTAIAASMLEARIPLMPREFDEIQLTTLNFLVKSTIQSSTGLSFALLGQDLARSSVNEEQLFAVLAIAYVKRLCSVVSEGVVDENIEALVEGHPRLLTFPEGDRRLLIRRLSSIVKLGLLQNGLVQLSIALKAPGLAGHVLSTVLAESGIRKTINQQNFNDLINERTLIVKVQAKLARELISEGFDEERACEIVEKALEKGVQNTPYSTIEEFANYLTMHFIQAGVKKVAAARLFAVKAAGYLISHFPRCLSTAPKLHAGFTLSLVDPKVLLTKNAIEAILEGYELDEFQSLYEHSIAELFVVADLKRLVSYLAVDPLLSNIEEHAPPMTLRQVLVDLYRVLLRRGVSVNDCLQIAQQMLKFLVYTPETQIGFNYPPNLLKVVLENYEKLFKHFGLEPTIANKLAQEIAKGILVSPAEISDLITVDRLRATLEEFIGNGAVADEAQFARTMKDEGISDSLAKLFANIVCPYIYEFRLPIEIESTFFELDNRNEGIASTQINADISRHLIKAAAENESTAYQVLAEAILSSTVIENLAANGDIDLTQIMVPVNRVSRLFFDKAATIHEESEFRSVLIQVMIGELRFLDSRECYSIAEELTINEVIRRELLFKQLLSMAKSVGDIDEKMQRKIRSAVYELYRSDVVLSDEKEVRKELISLLKGALGFKEDVLEKLMRGFKIGVPLIEQSSLWNNDFSPVLSEMELREQLSNCSMDIFRKGVSLEKSEKLTEELMLTLLGSMNVKPAEGESKSLKGLIKEQVEELVMHAESKQYKIIILDGVVDTMSSSARINFDMFVFTELLNMNGINFLKLVQQVLLNNVGVEDRSIEKTIDLLI